jgi:N-acetylglucosaminyl-diphospho-decaprenol L-rhamnosyltransferase
VSRAPNVSILVVSYNTKELTLACLESIRRTAGDVAHEVLVVDNASQDGSAAAIARGFPEVTCIELQENTGFARANNLAAQRARGRWLLLLNPDTLVLEGSLASLLAFAAAHPETRIFGGRTLFPDGTLNPTSCWRAPNAWSMFCLGSGLASLLRRHPWFDPESMGAWARDSEREVDIVSGCLLLIRRDLWESLGGFDEGFFMYGEDFDLCLRARRAGERCRISPRAVVIHYGGASERIRSQKMVSLFRTRARLYGKHASPLLARFGVAMLDLWALSRFLAFTVLAGIGRDRARESRAAWGSIWARRDEWRRERREGARARLA